jgi:hypothetical protein
MSDADSNVTRACKSALSPKRRWRKSFRFKSEMERLRSRMSRAHPRTQVAHRGLTQFKFKEENT